MLCSICVSSRIQSLRKWAVVLNHDFVNVTVAYLTYYGAVSLDVRKRHAVQNVCKLQANEMQAIVILKRSPVAQQNRHSSQECCFMLHKDCISVSDAAKHCCENWLVGLSLKPKIVMLAKWIRCPTYPTFTSKHFRRTELIAPVQRSCTTAIF